MSLFIINNDDFTDNIVLDTYSVNRTEITEEYIDANGVKHKALIREKVIGTFDVFFKTLTEYQRFIDAIANSKNTLSRTNPCTVAINNTLTVESSNYYITYAPVRTLNGVLQEFMNQYTVTLEEK